MAMVVLLDVVVAVMLLLVAGLVLMLLAVIQAEKHSKSDDFFAHGMSSLKSVVFFSVF